MTACFGLGRRRRLGERRDLQQLVDRRRLVLLFGEAVALRERRHLVGVDAVDQPVEVLAQPRVGPGAVRRLEEDVDRPVELRPRPIEVPELQLALAGVEMLLGGGDQRRDRIGRGLRCRSGSLRRGGRRCGVGWRCRGSAVCGRWFRSRHVTTVGRAAVRRPPACDSQARECHVWALPRRPRRSHQRPALQRRCPVRFPVSRLCSPDAANRAAIRESRPNCWGRQDTHPVPSRSTLTPTCSTGSDVSSAQRGQLGLTKTCAARRGPGPPA